jgi:hypothetical protein
MIEPPAQLVVVAFHLILKSESLLPEPSSLGYAAKYATRFQSNREEKNLSPNAQSV